MTSLSDKHGWRSRRHGPARIGRANSIRVRASPPRLPLRVQRLAGARRARWRSLTVSYRASSAALAMAILVAASRQSSAVGGSLTSPSSTAASAERASFSKARAVPPAAASAAATALRSGSIFGMSALFVDQLPAQEIGGGSAVTLGITSPIASWLEDHRGRSWRDRAGLRTRSR